MTPEKKLEVIRSWTAQFDICHNRCWAKLVYPKASGISYEYTPTCNTYDGMLDVAYNMVRNRIWNFIDVSVQ